MIRLAVKADIPRLVKMGLNFISSTSYRDFIDGNPDALAILMARLIQHEEAGLFVLERDGDVIGMIAGHLFTHPISGQRVGGEVFWWVEPGSRGVGSELLDRIEAWFTAMGCRKSQMIAPNDAVGRFYERRGYRRVETTYQRDLKK